LKEIVSEKIEKFKSRFKQIISQDKHSEFSEKSKFILDLRVKINRTMKKFSLGKCGNKRNKLEFFRGKKGVNFEISMKKANLDDVKDKLCLSSDNLNSSFADFISSDKLDKGIVQGKSKDKTLKISNSSLKDGEEHLKEKLGDRIVHDIKDQSKTNSVFQLNKFNNTKNSNYDISNFSLTDNKAVTSRTSRLKMMTTNLKHNSYHNTFNLSSGTSTLNSFKRKLSENNHTERTFNKDKITKINLSKGKNMGIRIARSSSLISTISK
jgi:hypothetical protein